ncbi:RNA-binding protein 8A [Cucumis melo var. makuwa]|uniref:RNA-binding protein 8A n=1 Tax=Cucumis melo var. makuwa TaxID=1194695 RepID=A0A5A7VIP1_CUCMM|nr:RNA-binding protein 8A [Cucumis melo var. makuwa]
MELWKEAGLAVVASVVGKPITLDLATKERHRLSYARLEKGGINSSPNKPSRWVEKELGKRDEFTLVIRKKKELVSVRDHSKSLKVTMLNSFGSLLDVLYVYAYDSNIEIQWLWRHLVEITLSGMEDFDLAICDVDLVKPSVWVWVRHEGVSPLVSLMRNLHHLNPALRRHFGRHIRYLSEEVCITKESMDRAQREMAVRFEEVSLHQKSRIRRLELGDHNTAYSIILLDLVAVNYFRNSLGLQIIGYRDLSPVIDDIVQFRWFEKCCLALQTPIELEEVRNMLFSIDSGKAPSCDGFSVGFFKGENSMFVVGVSSETASLLTGSMSFVMRQLPVHHLGLSLLLGSVHHEVDKILRLAIHDGPSWNIAMSMKILWSLLANSGSLWWLGWRLTFLRGGRYGRLIVRLVDLVSSGYLVLGRGCFMTRRVGVRLDFLIFLVMMRSGGGHEFLWSWLTYGIRFILFVRVLVLVIGEYEFLTVMVFFLLVLFVSMDPVRVFCSRALNSEVLLVVNQPAPLTNICLPMASADVEAVDFEPEEDDLMDEDGAAEADASPRAPFPKLKSAITGGASSSLSGGPKKTKGRGFREESDRNTRLAGSDFDSLKSADGPGPQRC